MPGDVSEEVKSVLSHSGFPLQMRVRSEIEDHTSEHEFSVIASDFRWTYREETGFVDLVLTKGVYVLVLECKRVGKPWVFLVPEKDGSDVSGATCLWTGPWKQKPGGGRSGQRGHAGIDFEPVSYEAEFCAISGSTDRRENMIERFASTLVRACESVYTQQMGSKLGQAVTFRAVYVPVIVTTADLHVAPVASDDVSLEDGRMRDPRSDRVDVVRLRKSLGQPWEDIEDLRDANEQSQRTVFVVRARAIVEFLKNWRLLLAPQWPEMRDHRLR